MTRTASTHHADAGGATTARLAAGRLVLERQHRRAHLIERSDDGPRFRDPAWLPPLTHWLDQLREAGVVSIEFTQDLDDPAVRIVRAWHSGPWRSSAEGRGPTDEEAAARCWMAVRRR